MLFDDTDMYCCLNLNDGVCLMLLRYNCGVLIKLSGVLWCFGSISVFVGVTWRRLGYDGVFG